MNYFSLYEALKAASYIMSKKDVRFFLKGVHVVKKDGVVTVEATNGFSLFQTNAVDPDSILQDEIDVIIEAPSVDSILRLGKNLTISRDTVNGVFKFNTIDAKFPDLNRIIDGSKQYPVYKGSLGMDLNLLQKINMSNKALYGSKNSKIEMTPLMRPEKPGPNQYNIHNIMDDRALWILMSVRLEKED